MAVPARASVDIFATDMGNGEVVIGFDARTEPNLVRAFALDIRLDNDVNIVDVTLLNPDYIIHPGTIQIDAQGKVTDYGTPVAPKSDLPGGTLPGLDSNGITIEIASRYSPVGPSSPNAPDPFGPLFSLRFDGVGSCCGPSGGCLTISPNFTRAGPSGIVMESPDEAVTVNLPAPLCVQIGPVCCYAGTLCKQWEFVGSPACWCAAGAPGANPRQCLGDAVGDSQGRQNYWTSTNDLAVLVAAWNKPYAQIAGQVEPLSGTPLICADFDHLPQGRNKYRVSANDLTILIANWNQKNAPGPTCP